MEDKPLTIEELLELPEEARSAYLEEHLNTVSARTLGGEIVEDVAVGVTSMLFAVTMKIGHLPGKLADLPPLQIKRIMQLVVGAFASNYRQAHGWLLDVFQIQVNAYYAKHAQADDYENRKSFVKEFDDELRKYSAAIAHPESGEPCILLAVASRDGTGRFTLENRLTKKRGGFYKSITELLPLKLVPDAPRKEGVIERRKKSEGSDG